VTLEQPSARQTFRVLTRTRTGYDDAVMHDVQLQVAETGAIVWVQTFTDEGEALAYQCEVEDDLGLLSEKAFRLKWSVPSSA
jgi:hypothetical protein